VGRVCATKTPTKERGVAREEKNEIKKVPSVGSKNWPYKYTCRRGDEKEKTVQDGKTWSKRNAKKTNLGGRKKYKNTESRDWGRTRGKQPRRTQACQKGKMGTKGA